VEWIRFEHEHEPYGVFSYLKDAAAALPAGDGTEFQELRTWFNQHLDAPERASNERFWFRVEAGEHAMRARRLAELVRKAGFPIVERRTRRVPGKVRWQDKHQVAVITFRDTPTRSKR
jgi:hypothetical protein